MQVVLNVKESFRTTESGHNREVVALYRWPLVQVPLYLPERERIAKPTLADSDQKSPHSLISEQLLGLSSGDDAMKPFMEKSSRVAYSINLSLSEPPH